MADLMPIRETRQMRQAAKDAKEQKYLAGAVPEKDGIITFTKSFRVPDKTKDEIYAAMLEYAKTLVQGSVPNSLRARIVNDDPTAGPIAAKVEEYMVFKKKPLYLDRAQFRYLFSAEVNDEGRVNLIVTQISYGYDEDNEFNFNTTLRAEEWISDKAALNKAGTKLYPRSGKFRRFTVDRVEKIFDNARNLFEEQKKITDKKKVDALVGE
jgi:hypothetical protein